MLISVRPNVTYFHFLLFLFLKKLNLDLADLRKEKEDLLKKLESSSEITSSAEVSQVTIPRIQVTSLGPSRSMDLEMKQLQCKLKVTIIFIKDENIFIY